MELLNISISFYFSNIFTHHLYSQPYNINIFHVEYRQRWNCRNKFKCENQVSVNPTPFSQKIHYNTIYIWLPTACHQIQICLCIGTALIEMSMRECSSWSLGLSFVCHPLLTAFWTIIFWRMLRFLYHSAEILFSLVDFLTSLISNETMKAMFYVMLTIAVEIELIFEIYKYFVSEW